MRKKVKHHAAERKPRQCGEAAANSVPPENSPKWTVSRDWKLLRKYICTQPQFQASPAFNFSCVQAGEAWNQGFFIVAIDDAQHDGEHDVEMDLSDQDDDEQQE